MIRQMPNASDGDSISQAARQLLASGSVGDEPLRQSGTVDRALPVRESGGELHSWFVPITVGDRLAAFFQFLPDGTLMRFSSFQRRPGEYAGCPALADWVDADRIQARAAEQLPPDETPGEPFLTFDRTPDRLVWGVPLSNKRGDVRLVYVVGETVYEPPPGGTYG